MKSSTYTFAILTGLVIGSTVVQAADPKKLYGTWPATGEPNATSCQGVSYVFTATTQKVRLSGSGSYGPVAGELC
jgi:hypothetical protein